MVNVNKLKGRIVERNSSVAELSEKMGIDKATFYRKLNEPGSFTIRDADAIKEALDLSTADAVAIFFADSVAETR